MKCFISLVLCREQNPKKSTWYQIPAFNNSANRSQNGMVDLQHLNPTLYLTHRDLPYLLILPQPAGSQSHSAGMPSMQSSGFEHCPCHPAHQDAELCNTRSAQDYGTGRDQT